MIKVTCRDEPHNGCCRYRYRYLDEKLLTFSLSVRSGGQFLKKPVLHLRGEEMNVWK